MADYYSILHKTISGLANNNAQTRQAVYAKARVAIDRQLRSLDPAPSEAVIDRQLGQLEESISRIEAEFSGDFAEADDFDLAPVAPPRRVEPERVAPVRQPEPEPAPRPAPQPVSRPVAQEPAQPRMDETRRPAPRPDAGAMRADADIQPEPRPLPGSVRSARPTPAHDSSLDALDNAPVSRARPPRRPAADLQRRRSRTGPILLALFLLLVLGAGGYAAWRFQEPILAALGMGGGQSSEQVTAAGQDAAAAGDQEPGQKEEVRLGADGTTVEPPKPVEQPASGQDQAQDQAQAGQDDAADATDDQATLPLDPQQSDGGEQSVAPVQDGLAQDQAAAQQGGDAVVPPIAQKAFLYEEGAAGAGPTRDTAAIIWSLAEESPLEGVPAEAVIKGQLDVPGRGLAMTLTIRRNADEALPASHIIELVFTAPQDFSGGNIDNVARFVMKSSEQARGEGLVAVPAKIDTGYFLMALNNLPQALETNRKLMVDSSWIDIPLSYTSGKRALVALEKGAIGDKVFRDAFADWDNR
jgi:hypothetical protein